MARFLLLMRNDDENNLGHYGPEDWDRLMQRFVDWTEGLEAAGRLHAVERLDRGGRNLSRSRGQLVVDGPYAEGKEAVLGLYLIEAADLDEATEVAGTCPVLDVGGEVELREVAPFPP